MEELRTLIDKLHANRELTHDEYVFLLEKRNPSDTEYLRILAQEVAIQNYGRNIFLRGLIEVSNYCKNDCYYCGIRRSNRCADRYRLTAEQILACCEVGYENGFRTFVLQGGEDPYYTDDMICEIVRSIKTRYPECAVTLSLGEKTKESYQRYYDAGADRYLLRHETATDEHYRMLHPEEMSLEVRKQCLRDLKSIGFQVGAGFMVGAPGQTYDNIASDFEYLKELEPHMIGIGPFLHHKDTPFRDEPDGSFELTIYCLSILRLMFPSVLLPATTALGTIHPEGREIGIKAGANVIMPNLSPEDVRGKYLLYDGKICTGEELAVKHKQLEDRMNKINYTCVSGRGDYAGWTRQL